MIRKLSVFRSRSKHYIYVASTNNGNDYSIYNLYDNYDYDTEDKSPKLPQHPERNLTELSFRNHTTYMKIIGHMLHNQTKPQSDINSEIYNIIFDNHDVDTVFGTLSFSQRCDLYFKNVFADNVNWFFNPDKNYDVKFDDDEYKKYMEINEQRFKEEFEPKLEKLKDDEKDKEYENFLHDKYRDYMNPRIDQDLINHLTMFRIFNKCYITNDEVSQINQMDNFITTQQKLVHSENSKPESLQLTEKESLVDLMTSKSATFEHRMYPWLSKEYPVYQRFTGKVYHEPPNYYDILKDPFQKTSKKIKSSNQLPNQPFIQKFKNKCNGKGIVLSIANKHVEYTVQLIHLLRALDNRLPIQIVYYDDVSEESKMKIVTAAQEEYKTLPESFQKVSHFFDSSYLDKSRKGLRPQEVWFVNAYNAIHKSFRGKFSRFGNKLLATFFNSFEEFMLIDADTVMMQPPEFFFNLEGYKKTGSYFFKDRSVQRRSINDGLYMEKMAPATIDSVMFDIPIMTNYTKNREFFKGLQHYMESGLVMLNKNIHLNSILMISQINFLRPIAGKVYGDKELFWLGFAINGDENYFFDSNFAAAIGQLTPPDDRLRDDGTRHHSQEICSPHPGHVSAEDNHTLLWINSGFRFCHQADEVNYEEEADKKTRLKFLTNAQAFRNYYYEPLRISHAIVPPLDEKLQARKNYRQEPERGWYWEKEYCRRYMWCAYSSIGGKQKESIKKDNTLEGLLISYSDNEVAMFNYLGDVWVGIE
ncbi:MNN1 putative alpha-1 [Candida maltosa Xu316]